MRTARKGTVEMPAFMRQLVKETEKRVSSFFKGGRGGAAEGEQPGEGEKEEVIPSPYLDRPVLDKLAEEGCARWGLTYALGSMQGWRANMEDFHNCVPQLGGELADWSFFAVFDGHAGSTVAQYCSQHLLGHILATGERYETERNEYKRSEMWIVVIFYWEIHLAIYWADAERSLLLFIIMIIYHFPLRSVNIYPVLCNDVFPWDEKIVLQCVCVQTGGIGAEDDPERVKGAIVDGFLQTDKHLLTVARREGWERGGTTVVATLISPYYIYFANCGDSRAMLCRSGQVCFSTEDHKPYCPLEKERIESAGGSVTIQRINGSLAVSRALGDFSYKGAENRTPCQQMVSPEPEVCVVERSPADEFLVLACDGVWDTISNEELCAFIHNRLRVCTDLRDVCTQVIDLCLYKVRTCCFTPACASSKPKHNKQSHPAPYRCRQAQWFEWQILLTD